MKIAIIGGGASGVIASIKASEIGDVTLFERNDKCLRKLLLTGNGKCNYWNSSITKDKYQTDNYNNLEKILTRKEEVFNYLTNIGIYPTIKNDLYYPYSGTSYSIKEILDNKLSKVNIIYNAKIDNIKKEDKFIITVNNKEYIFDKLILSTGSCATPKTGSDGSGYDILKKFNHTINTPLPALVQIKTNGSYLKDWSGLRVDANIKLYVNDNYIKEESGELQLTEFGLSGICIFNLSSIISKSLYQNKKVKLSINFFKEDFYSFMEQRSKMIDDSLSLQIESIFNYKLSNIFFKLSKINKDIKWQDLSKEEKIIFSNLVNNFEVTVIGTNDFDKAQVATGGLSLNEINPQTMESIIIDNLYITGELLDVDGICGGYNLSFAFITGYIAGELND